MPARESLDALARFAGAVAHDFNNIFTGLLGQMSLARMTGQFDPIGLEQMEQLTLRAIGLCRQLTTISGRGNSNETLYAAASVIRSTLETLREQVPTTVELHMEIADDLPPVKLAGSELQFLLETLVRNAAVTAKRVEVRLSSTAMPVTDWPNCLHFASSNPSLIFLEVRDNGAGVSESIQPRLGEPFASTHGPGRGLSLALALGLLRGCQGSLDMFSQGGEGTLVRVGLPTASPPSSAPASSSGSSPADSPTILLVDDESSVREIAARLLKSLNYQVIEAADGPEAIAQLTEHFDEIDLALVDMTMPGMDGLATVERLHQLKPSLLLTLMSGYPEHGLGLDGSNLPIHGFLPKPFRLPALRELLNRVLPLDATT